MCSCLVSSCLDYCSLVLFETAYKDPIKLRRVQNRWRQSHHHFTCSAPLLHSLHCLPLKSGINFKIYLLKKKSMPTWSLPACSLQSHKGISLVCSQGQDPNRHTGILLLWPFLVELPPGNIQFVFSPINCNFQETPQDAFLWLGLPPINASRLVARWCPRLLFNFVMVHLVLLSYHWTCHCILVL